ncbi:MAG: alpha/beta fold hydrolase [Deltaproteobacteria bacterium]|nr:alpha/beta fold hydrolase [Deltaproteobacteria bacterium]
MNITTRPVLIVLTAWMIVISMAGCESKDQSRPLSFETMQTAEGILPETPQFIKASDGVALAYYPKMPESTPEAALIFLHGGGAYSGAGYQHLAGGLAEKYHAAVYLVDLRGHGHSGGPRGDTPSVEQIWKDLRLMVETVRKNHPNLPLYLGGHSSGGGLILNYYTWSGKADVDGYFFISPQFGYKSETARPQSQTSFAKPRLWVFVVSALSGGRCLGHTRAVSFNYPQDVLTAKPLMLKYITRHMSVAITPDHPQEQFGKIDKRFALYIGAKDELFVPQQVIQYAGYAQKTIQTNSVNRIIENESHLSILSAADDLIGQTIIAWQKTNRTDK